MMQLTSVFQHFLDTIWPSGGHIIITGQNKKTFWPAQTETAFHGKRVGWCRVWLMILFTYLISLWIGHRWVSWYWNILESSDQNANLKLYHHLLLWYFKLGNAGHIQVCCLAYNLSSLCCWCEKRIHSCLLLSIGETKSNLQTMNPI